MEGKIFSWDFLMTTVLFRFLLVYGRTILVLQFFFINLPLKLFNFNFIFFFLKIILILNLEEKNLAGHFHSIIIYLPFSQYNHVQNFEEKKLFQHFANLIKIRSNYTPGPRRGRGVYCFTSVRPSFQNIFRHTFLSNYWWQKSGIWSQASYRYPISWEVAGVS